MTTTEEHQGWMVVALNGEVDFSTDTPAAVALHEACASCPWLVVDCASLTFCDSSFLGTLINAFHRAQAGGGTLVVAAAQPQLQRLLARTGLTEVFPLFPSVAEAISRPSR